MPPTIDDLFATPDHYLHSFDGDAAIFMPMDRAAYHRSIFLDQRISPAAARTIAFPVQTLLQHPSPAASTAWIFHMAHCGSTLLARALDNPTASLVLREPFALRQLGLRPDTERLNLVLAMLGKRYRADAPTLVKANVPVNFLLPQLAAADPDARTIFLYLPLRPYLLAILRSEAHRIWVRNVTVQLKPYLGDLSSAPDAERAATLWLTQIEAFAGALSAMPNAAALNAERLFAEPLHVLEAATRHFGMPISDAALEATVAGPLFSTHSKNPSIAFDNTARIALAAETECKLQAEIAAAEAWIAERGATPSPDVRFGQRELIH
ncbi:hypothetical protein [Sphingomonas asaccharolytica]|uniref:hypothetical protein n=1 Tax=Sphingomonas asaccharolytica TaxID=40681 RepID=UPI000835299D|nr:hypothetical protein [Sphingomonas asaccharolytica]